MRKPLRDRPTLSAPWLGFGCAVWCVMAMTGCASVAPVPAIPAVPAKVQLQAAPLPAAAGSLPPTHAAAHVPVPLGEAQPLVEPALVTVQNTPTTVLGEALLPPRNTATTGTEAGIASWYGPGFQGRRTASGERFNTQAMTAAHKTLPFGTRVRVTSAATGKEVVVRINDRGPFIAGRIIDLSRAAAQALGFVGIKRVELQVLP